MVGVGRRRVCTEPLPGPRDTPDFTILPLNGCQFSSNQMVAPHGCGYVPSLWFPPRTMPGKVRVACTSPHVQTASVLGARRPASGPACPPWPLQVPLRALLSQLERELSPPCIACDCSESFHYSRGSERWTGQAESRRSLRSQPWEPPHWGAPLCAGHRAPRRGRPGGGRAAPRGARRVPSLKTGQQRQPPSFPTPPGRKMISADFSCLPASSRACERSRGGQNSGRSKPQSHTVVGDARSGLDGRAGGGRSTGPGRSSSQALCLSVLVTPRPGQWVTLGCTHQTQGVRKVRGASALSEASRRGNGGTDGSGAVLEGGEAAASCTQLL